MGAAESEKYLSYKMSVLTLVLGILVGVLTNYIAYFFPANNIGLALSIFGIFLIGFFFISRYRTPTFSVFQEFPEGLITGKLKPVFVFKETYDILVQRFLYLANLDVSYFADTLFKPSRFESSIFSNLYPFSRFLPLSKNEHIEEMGKISESISLSDVEKEALKEAVRKKYENSVLLQTGEFFKYRCVSNRLLRGKGVFYLNIHERPSIGCIIIPSISCITSRHYEEYHILLRKKLANTLKKLTNDHTFRKNFVDLFE